MSFLKPSALFNFLILCSSLFHELFWSSLSSVVDRVARRRSTLRWWPSREALKRFLVMAFAWSFLMFVEIRLIESSSMYPALCVGDRIIVEKVSYYFKSPDIEDIVLFRAPKNLQDLVFRKDEVIIKRIVAKAGDLIEVNHGLVYINGIAKEEDFISEQPTYRLNPTVGPCYLLCMFFFQPIHMVFSCTGRACSRTTLRSRHCQSKLPTGSLFRMHCRRQLESEERAIRLVDSMLLTTECFIDTFLLS